MARTKPQTHATAGPEIATLRISIIGSKPRIWRQLDVPTSQTLLDLHHVIQVAFLWDDEHLWQFEVDGRRYRSFVDDDEDSSTANADPNSLRLRDVVRDGAATFSYVYDFGDYWELGIALSKVRAGEAEELYPRLTSGSQAAPPENIGGIDGYYWWLDAARNPDHPEHDDAMNALGEHRPEDMGRDYIDNGLARIARARTGAD